jgi:membrane protease subunit HflK
MYFVVEADEVGVILRFGKFHSEVSPGLNFKIPIIDQVEKVPVLRQLKHEFGFRTIEANVRSTFSNDILDESLMLTGDLNSATVEWIAQYNIKDAYKYLFKVNNVEQTFRYINEAVMREIVGDRSVNEVITIGREEIALLAKQRIQEICDQYETGISVEQIILQDVNPPEDVKPAFNEVNEAEQQKNRMINEALSEYNKIIPKARGDARRIIEEARGYYTERINRAKGDAQRFNEFYREYLKAPEVTKQRIYQETMQEILSKVGKKIISDEKAGNILPIYDLNKGVQK